MSDHMRTGSTLHCGTLQYATGNVGWNCGNVSNLTIYGGHAIQSPQKDCRKYCRLICFIVLYFLLPSSIYTYIGILGGIGVGLSAKYGWQAVFNTFGALAIATESYGLKGAVGLRVIQNVFGVVFALIFCSMFYWLMSKKKETVVTVAAK